MNTALWVAQGLAALIFLLTGGLKVVTPKEKLTGQLRWTVSWPPGRIKLLGLAEVAGAFGLVLPAALQIAPALTPIAAAGLGVLMIGAVQTHRRLQEGFAPALILVFTCLISAVGRFPSGA